MGNTDLLAAKWFAFHKDERNMGDIPWHESYGPMLEKGTDIGRVMGLERVPLSELPATIGRDALRFAHLIDR